MVLENPNIGGTEFVTIQLALELAESDSNLEVLIVTICPFYINAAPKNLKIISLTDDFVFKKDSVVVLNSQSIPILNSMQTEKLYVILWSHHPHDFFNKRCKL